MCVCVCVCVCVLIAVFLEYNSVFPSTGPSHNNAVVNKVGNKVNGLFLSISLDTLVSVTEVVGDKVTTENVGYLDDRQRMRSPCVSCPHGYNSLWANVTNQLIVPDVNALKIVNEDGTHHKTVTLTNCDPYSMHTLLHDHSILWVLCNPVGNQARVYRVSLMNLTTEMPLVVSTNSRPFLPRVGVIFEQGGVLHAILATANGLAFASQDTPGVQPLDWNKRCLSVLRLTDFNDLLLKKILIECGNGTSQTVENTYLCDYNFECSDVLLPSRTLGKIITSDDVSILASVAPNRIDILEWNQGHVSRVVPSPNHKFHDAYIERVTGSHLMVYSDKGGKVHLYNVSAALNGDDVSPQTIEGDYVTCEDCSGLVMIGEGYFVTATDPEGVAWFSTTPPELLRTSRGIKADRLAYSSSQFPTAVVDTVTESPKTNPMMGAIVGGVVGPFVVIVVIISLTLLVGIVVILHRRDIR